MSYFVESRWGGVEAEPPVWRMRKILAALDDRDPEHAEPWLTHESGWTLSVNANGAVVWTNDDEEFAPRHLVDVSRAEMLRLWRALAEGEIEAMQGEPWLFGLPPAVLAATSTRADRLQHWLVGLSVALAVSWLIVALASVGAASWLLQDLILAANVCLPALIVGVVLTAVVRAAASRGPHGRDHRIARACVFLALVLAGLDVLVAAVWLALELPDSKWGGPVQQSWLLLAVVVAVLVCGACLVGPALVVALFAAERAKRARG